MKYYECHGHIALGSGTIEEKLLSLAKAGVIYFRDAGSADGLSNGNEAAMRSKELGIDFVTPVFALYKEGLYGKFLGKSFSDTKDFYQKLKEAKSLGADYIKVMYSGIASFKELGKLSCEPLLGKEIKEIVSICHGEGLAVMAHCNGVDTIKYAIEYGTDSIEHGIFIDDEGIRMLAASNGKTIWIPTLSAIANEVLAKNHKLSITKAFKEGAVIGTGSDCGCSSVAIESGAITEFDLIQSCLTEAFFEDNSFSKEKAIDIIETNNKKVVATFRFR